jgi:protease IV
MSEEQKPPGDPNEPLPTAPPPASHPPPFPPSAQGASQPVSQPAWGGPPPVPPPPSSWAQPPPPAIPPPVPPRRDRAALAIVLFVFGGLFVVFFAFLLLAYSAVRGESARFSSGPRIGVVEVKGEIGSGGRGRGSVDPDDTLKVVKRFIDDADMKAVVVRIDSPGGAVAPSQEIYDELRKLADKKIVVCSMGNIAASGGFYIAMACPHIMAEPGTLTGSIGVISMFPNVKGLAERFNVKLETVKSGKLKDAGNPFRDMTPEDRAYWQSLVDQVYLQFLGAVVESRELPEAEVRKIADGRVLTGQQAQELGLIDELGNFNDAVDAAKEKAGLTGEPRLVYPPDDRTRFFEELLGGAVHSIADAVRTEVREQANAAVTPGLYYMAR